MHACRRQEGVHDFCVLCAYIHKSCTLLTSVCYNLSIVSRFDKRVHLSLFVDFELAILGGSTVDELFVALCFTSIAVPMPMIRWLKLQNRPCTIMRKRPIALPLLYQ